MGGRLGSAGTALVVVLALSLSRAAAQQPPPNLPAPLPAEQPEPEPMPEPPALDPSNAPPSESTANESQEEGEVEATERLSAIEARLEALERRNRALAEENRRLREWIVGTGGAPPGSETDASAATPVGPGPRSLRERPGGTSFEAVPDSPVPSYSGVTEEPEGPAGAPSGTSMGAETGTRSLREMAGGTSFEAVPDSPVPSYSGVTEEPPDYPVSILGRFDQGFEFRSDDDEFMLQVHLESQTDYRAFDPNGDSFAQNGFYAPRNRILFGGRVTRPIEYLFSINKGFGNLNLLDAYVNLRADDRFQLKIGRFMTPFNYEQFAIQNLWLIAPERSLFTANLGLNRQLGAQLWGSLFEERLDYAVGVYDGPRNSFEDFNNSQDVMTFLNARPFQARPEGHPLRFLNLGGSFVYGDQNNPLFPASFRVASNASNTDTADRAAPPFLVFNPGVIPRGQRTSWSAHLAYFYRSLSLLADYNGSIQRFARRVTAPRSEVLPAHGYSVAAGYFLTGEELERRTIVEPLRPFRLRRGDFSLGAVELIGRFSTFDIDSDIFATGLADRNLWSNRAWITNLGVNWYPTRHIKIILDWQHAEFGDPVFFAFPDRRSLTNEMLWLRFQFYY